MKLSAVVLLCAALVCGSALAGCGSASSSSVPVSPTAAAESPVDSTGESTEQETETDTSLVGYYTEHGYSNSYFSYQIALPESWTLEQRSGTLSYADNEGKSVVEASNDARVVKDLTELADSVNPQAVFSADDDTHSLNVMVQSPVVDIMSEDFWDEETAVAEASADNVKSEIESLYAEAEQCDLSARTTTYTIAGQTHAAVAVTGTINEIPYYAAQIFIRSDDGAYLFTIGIESIYTDDTQTICDYFSRL